MSEDVAARLAAVWRIEGPAVIATLARVTRDVALAEDLASEATLAALRQWPADGVPKNPGAWLTAVAKRRAIDTWRQDERRQDRFGKILRWVRSRYSCNSGPRCTADRTGCGAAGKRSGECAACGVIEVTTPWGDVRRPIARSHPWTP